VNRGRAFAALAGCGAAGILGAFAIGGAPIAGAENGTTSSTTSTVTTATTTAPPSTTAAPTTTTTPPPKQPDVIAAGVTIGRLLVGGLSPAEATELVKERFQQPLTLVVGPARRLQLWPRDVGAASYVGDAVKLARRVRPGYNVPLRVHVPRGPLQRYLRTLAEELHRDPVDSRVILRKLRPHPTEAVPGRRLKELVAQRELTLALKTHVRTPLQLPFEELKPAVTQETVGPVLIIRRGSNRLLLFNGKKLKLQRTFHVATGQNSYPTPLGRFEVKVMWRNPWWVPPPSEWAKDKRPVPPGPGNPLGTRWMGLSAPYVGIHGTPDAASIGYSVSHGCIRMLIPEVEWLFERVEVGTTVFIVAA
jgi:lipoprotein-anchoring transpeptidase ErfK/SrfK